MTSALRAVRGLFLALLLAPSARGQSRAAPRWYLAGDTALFRMTARGSVHDSVGATLSLRGSPWAPGAVATVTGSWRADAVRGRRLVLAGDMDVDSAGSGASLWLAIDGPTRSLEYDNGMSQPVTGTTKARRKQVSLFVPPDATRIRFGLILSGSGAATVRNLRLESRAPVVAALPPQPQAILDSAIAIVKRNAMWRDTVTWSFVEPMVRDSASNARTAAEVYPAIRLLLKRLGDNHSSFSPPVETKAFTSGGAANPLPLVRAEQRDIGYISVFSYAGVESKAASAYVKAVHDSIAAVISASSNQCRWVIDLRANPGGNMWTMLAGLKPFLGDAPLGAFVMGSVPSPPWRAGANVVATAPESLRVLESAHVAVLYGPRTASSGEATAIAFRGRPRSRSFGLPTFGLSTANATFPLGDGSMIVLTIGIDADRTGQRYGHKLDPDEVVPVAPAGDAQLARAIEWLRAQPACDKPNGDR